MYASVCTEIPDQRSENWKFNHESTGSYWCDMHQKNRLETRNQVICVTIALTRVRTLIFSQNRHALRSVLVRRHDRIAHKSLQKSRNEILLYNWATLSNFYFIKKIDLLVKILTLLSKNFQFFGILLHKVIFFTNKSNFVITYKMLQVAHLYNKISFLHFYNKLEGFKMVQMAMFSSLARPFW